MAQSNGGITQTSRVSAYPMVNVLTGQSGLYAFDAPQGGFNDLVNPSNYFYRMEVIVPGKTPTVNSLIVEYRDLGLVGVTFNLTGTNDDQKIVSATSGLIVLGNLIHCTHYDAQRYRYHVIGAEPATVVDARCRRRSPLNHPHHHVRHRGVAMKPRRTLGFTTPTLDNLADWHVQHGRVLDGNISFGGTMSNSDRDRNITCWKAAGTTPGAANTDFTITHGLNRVPKTLLGQDTNNGGLLYRSPATAWTKTAITLRCTTATAAYNVIFD